MVRSLAIVLVVASSATAADPWPAAKPEDVGLNPKALAALDADLARGEKYGNVDTFTVIRRGKVAFDKTYARDYDALHGRLAKTAGSPAVLHDRGGPYNYYAPWWHPYYRRGDLHTLQSITKTVISVVVGVALGRGEFPPLDTKVMTYFDAKAVANLDDRKRKLTIRHLLTMTSGMDWNYARTPSANEAEDTDTGFEGSHDWVKFAIDRRIVDEPGAKFNYASGAVQILVHVFRAHTGTDIEEYAARHLFKPLGIDDWYWKRAPGGAVDGSGGLYLRPRDLTKFGHLHLKGGAWDGKQVVPAAWVKESVTGHVETPTLVPGAKYGYLWGVKSYGEKGRHTSFGAGGYGGQGVVVLPDHDAVVSFTGWTVIEGKPKLWAPEIGDLFVAWVTDPK